MSLSKFWGIISVALISTTVIVSCSSGSNPAAPRLSVQLNDSISSVLGSFQIIPGPELESAEIIQDRSAQFDVTKWAQVSVIAANWDDILRNWTLTVKINNPTQFTGWGVRAIFTELGGKELRWPDGFLWLDLKDPFDEDERYPFFAIEKTTENREFPGFHTSIQDLTFHFPDGVDKWVPISFFIDAHLFTPRPDPMVEDPSTAHFPPPCQHGSVSALVQDHQSMGTDLTVWIDLTPIGAVEIEPMFDDGGHGDGASGDGIFGVEITGGVVGELYNLTVYAEDSESNRAENDVIYAPIEFPPLPPIPFETLMSGPWCLLTEERLEVIRDQETFDKFWNEFAPWDMPPPIIDFDTYQVIVVAIGQRDNDCYSVEVNDIAWSSENCGWVVNYTETVPGPKCECAEVIRSPFHLITTFKSSYDVIFKSAFYEDPCSDVTEAPVSLAIADPIPQTICADVHFNDNGSYDPDGGPLVYEWDWDNDGIYDEQASEAWHTWNTPGTYYVNFRVTDDENQSAELPDPLEIVMENASPVPLAEVSKTDPVIDEIISFDASSSYDGDCAGAYIVLYEWDFDFDGTFVADSTEPIASHSYSMEGVYQVQLRVTDNDGESAMLKEPVLISVRSDDPCLDLELVVNGSYGGYDSRTMTLINDQSTWAIWWAANAGGTPPVVDFETEMIIALTMGTCTTSGYFGTVDSACIGFTEMLELSVTWHSPGEGCMTLPVITNPYSAYRMNKVENPEFWVEYYDTYKCD